MGNCVKKSIRMSSLFIPKTVHMDVSFINQLEKLGKEQMKRIKDRLFDLRVTITMFKIVFG